jgi:hypothetical protein
MDKIFGDRNKHMSSNLQLVILLLILSNISLVYFNFELRDEYDSLESELRFWTQQNEDLRSDYLNLVERYSSLVGDYRTLSSEYTRIYRKHDEEAVSPPYTLVSGREVHMVWKDSKGELMEWVIPMDSYRQQISQDKPREYLRLKDGSGKVYMVMDFRPFIDTYFFSEVIPDLYEDTGDEGFVREVWHLATSLTVYTSEIRETPRWPIETLVEGGGDCEDVAILIASMLKAADAGYRVKLLYINFDDPTHLGDPNHVIVYVEKGDFKAFIDGTSDVMDPYDNPKGWSVEV